MVAQGYKQTEVGVIPDDWQVSKIKDVCQLINGRGFKPFEWKKNGLPIIRIQNLNGSEDFNYYEGQYDSKIEVENGQLLFAWSGSRGTSFGPHVWQGTKALLNYHTWKILINEEKIDKSYFKYALKNLTKYIEDNAHGASALVHTQKWEMEGFSFPYPLSISEQTAIATALSDTDSLISSLEGLIAKKRNIKQGAMQELLKPKGGWEVKKLGEVCDVRDGTHDSPKYVNDGVYFITSKNIINSKLDYTDVSLISKEDANQINQRSKVDNGDIIMSMIGTIGNAVLVDFNPDFCIKNVALLKPKKVYNYFLIQLINSNLFQTYLESKLDGGIQKFISLGVLRELEISFPIKQEEQSQIATILSDMDNEITALETKLEKYKQLKQGMMQNLLTGKIRIYKPIANEQ